MQARDETFGQLDFSLVRSVFSIVLTVFPVFLPVTKEGYTKIREADSVGFCLPVTITKIQIKKPKSKSGLNIFNYPRRQSLFPFLEEWGHWYGQSLRDSRILEKWASGLLLVENFSQFLVERFSAQSAGNDFSVRPYEEGGRNRIDSIHFSGFAAPALEVGQMMPR